MEINREIMSKLQEPFPAEDIEWRTQQSGFDKNGNAWAMIMPYVTSRAIQQRLDEVIGASNWKNEFTPITTTRGLSFMCGISIYSDATREWVTKYDGADETDFESFKGGISNAMKRAGVQWGIGRYLYKLDVVFATLLNSKAGHFETKIKDKDGKSKWYSYNFPTLPEWALPEGASAEPIKVSQVKDTAQQTKGIEEGIKKELGGRDFEEETNNCKTLQELSIWYNNLPSFMKVQGSDAVFHKDRRKLDLVVKENQSPPPVHSPSEPIPPTGEDTPMVTPTFEELKAMTLVQLRQIAKKYGVTSYSKRSKADLINAILKIINNK